MKKTIEVEIRKVSKNELHLTQHLGDGTLGQSKFDASVALPTMSMIVTVEDKKYMVISSDLIEAMIKHHQTVVIECSTCEDTGKVNEGEHDNINEVKCPDCNLD